MKKNQYRALSAKDLDLLSEGLPAEVTFGIDVAKRRMFGALMGPEEEVLGVLKWDHLSESRQIVAWLAGLAVQVQVALEPSGTYGDALRCLLSSASLPVYRVSPKQVKDVREVYDGVPSNHDAKSCAIVAWLHQLGRSDRWEFSDRKRRLAAAIGTLDLHESGFRATQNRLEAQLARHWPEVTELMELDSATLLELLGHYGSPEAIVAAMDESEELMRSVGGARLSEDKIQAVLDSAEETLGVPMIAEEVEALQELAREARHRQKCVRSSRRRVVELNEKDPVMSRVGCEVGRVTAGVLTRDFGSLKNYRSAGSLIKAAGLNLKEISSGRRQGELGITKRGPRRSRQYLYLAVLRWIQKDAWARAWYERKLARDGGRKGSKGRALVALMRKLLKGLWWVAQGERFDSEQLFDTRRLATA